MALSISGLSHRYWFICYEQRAMGQFYRSLREEINKPLNAVSFKKQT
jgi:hypothetical protein